MKKYYVVETQGSYVQDVQLSGGTKNGTYWASYTPISEFDFNGRNTWIPELDKFTIGSSPFPNVEGIFTQSEIDSMPECYTHPAVWEKIKVEREEQ